MVGIGLRPFALSVLVFTAAQDVRAQDPPPLNTPLATTENAALVYWQAIGLLPDWTEEQRPFIDRSPFDFDPDEAATAVFVASEPVMRLMRYAASLPQCDWGTNRALMLPSMRSP